MSGGIRAPAAAPGDANDVLEMSMLGLDDDAMGPAPPLCERCRRFDIQTFARSSSAAARRRGYLLRDVQEGAAQQCVFCTVLHDSVKDLTPPRYFYRGFYGARFIWTHPDLYVHMTISQDYGHGAGGGGRPPAPSTSMGMGLGVNRLTTEVGDRLYEVTTRSEHELCLAADPASPAAHSGDIIGRYLGRDPNSDDHYALIHEWIEQCASHTRCNHTASGSTVIDARRAPLPTRCMMIEDGGGGEVSIALRETEGMHGAYITLSHRWQRVTADCVTTMENYHARLQGKRFGNLPRLFRDLFIIASRLNVRYVWIDSLCIIQKGDNGEDWTREASKMAQYYQFSLVTVAGIMTDTEKGILQRYPSEHSPWERGKLLQMPYRSQSTSCSGHFYIYRRKTPLVEQYWDTIRSSNLLRRGWVVQEWILSKRLLCYTPNGIFFECHTDAPRTEYQESLAVDLAPSFLRAHLRLKDSLYLTHAHPLDLWYQIVEVYSGCHFTKPEEDRILALAGFASEIGHTLVKQSEVAGNSNRMLHPAETYMSGIWLSDVHHGLLWEEDPDASPNVDRLADLPSWSWSSILCPVKWPKRSPGTFEELEVTGVCLRKRDYHHDKPDYRVNRNNATPEADNSGVEDDSDVHPTAQPDITNQNSCLHVRGKLQVVHVRGYLETEENLHTAAALTACDAPASLCRWRAICLPTEPEVIVGWGSLEQMPPQDGCADAGIAVLALHVSTGQLRTGILIKRTEPVLNVLLVAEVSDGDRVYRRLGTGRIASARLARDLRAAEIENLKLV